MHNKFRNNQQLIQQVWEKALIIDGLDKDLYRADHCGAIIRRDLFMKEFSTLTMGWQIDRIKPEEFGGTDDLSNLQPLQWENSKKKANEYPYWTCLVKAIGKFNVYVRGEGVVEKE